MGVLPLTQRMPIRGAQEIYFPERVYYEVRDSHKEQAETAKKMVHLHYWAKIEHFHWFDRLLKM